MDGFVAAVVVVAVIVAVAVIVVCMLHLSVLVVVVLFLLFVAAVQLFPVSACFGSIRQTAPALCFFSFARAWRSASPSTVIPCVQPRLRERSS